MVPFSQTCLHRARKTIRLELPMLASIEARIAEHTAAPTLPLPIVASPPLPYLTTQLLGPPMIVRTDISDGLEISDGRELAFTTPRSRTRDWGERMMSSRCDRGAQDELSYLRARVNALFRDRPYHRHTAMILDREAMYARIAWTSSEDRSAAIEAHVRTLEAQVATLIAPQTTSLQTQLTTTLGRIETLEAGDPEPQDRQAEAGNSC
ncbi:hypothetical protein Tco_1275850 [Tanacetum coccineum]